MTEGDKYYKENKTREMVLILKSIVRKGLTDEVENEKIIEWFMNLHHSYIGTITPILVQMFIETHKQTAKDGWRNI